jgi:hypothetical protein
MSANRSAGLVLRWVALYTRGLPDDTRQNRRDEIHDDLWSQLQDAAESSRGTRSVSGEILARLLLGVPADIGWRLEQSQVSGAPEAPEARPSMDLRFAALMAVLGGVGWDIGLVLQAVLGEAAWTTAGVPWLMMLTIVGGTWALALATVVLIVAFQDSIRGVAALAGSIGASAGALSVMGAFGLIVALPLGTGVVAWELGRVGGLSARVARAHVATAILAIVPIVVIIANPALLNGAVGLLTWGFLILYGVSWIAIGWSLRHVASMRDEPTKGG